MPMSAWMNTDLAIRHIRLMKPKTVLDIGIGFGKWGYLIRGSVETERGRMEPKEWEITLTGVEACDKYLKMWQPMLHLLYNRIVHQDVLNFDLDSEYDMVIAGDVLEHLSKDDSINTIRRILNRCKSFIFVIPTGKGWENSNSAHTVRYPFEEHKSVWQPHEMEDLAKHFGFKVQCLDSRLNNKTITTFLGEKI